MTFIISKKNGKIEKTIRAGNLTINGESVRVSNGNDLIEIIEQKATELGYKKFVVEADGEETTSEDLKANYRNISEININPYDERIKKMKFPKRKKKYLIKKMLFSKRFILIALIVAAIALILLIYIIFIIDTNPPVISNLQPENQSIVTSSPIILGVDTNEKAECRYSKESGMVFNDMIVFENTNSTEHKSSIDVEDSTTYDYYIKCKDMIGNINLDDYHITFTAQWNNPPTPPSNIKPEITHNKTPTISWDPSFDSDGDMITYHINAGTTYRGTDLLNNVTITDTSINITKVLSYGTTVYVSIYSDDGIAISDVVFHTFQVIAMEEPTNVTEEENVTGGPALPGGGGGGPSPCIPTWDCTPWSECTPEGIQTRTCTDITCGSGSRLETQSCDYVPTEYNITLTTGQNLISLPLTPENTSTSSVLSSIEGNYSIIWTYNASDTADPWKKHDPTAPSGNDLLTMEPSSGYWIDMLVNDTLIINGSVPSFTFINLKAGTNLIGYPSFTSQPISTALSSIEGNYSIIWTYNASDTADPWKKYDPTAPSGNDLLTMEPGSGYWINMTTDAILTV